jgi:hypothetical protein
VRPAPGQPRRCSRRSPALRGLLGSIGVAEEGQAQATSCVLIPAKTEAPYFVDEKLNRSDIRANPSDGATRPGMPAPCRGRSS